MPVKIVECKTDASKGEISRADLLTIPATYVNEVEIKRIHGDEQVVKTIFCYFKKEDVAELLEGADENGGLKIYFGISLPGQKSCTGEDYSNRITVTVFATDSEGNDHKDVNDFVLTPGFKNSSESKGTRGGDCCGSMYPMT